MTVYTHRDVNVLAIETSCDETACSIVRNGREVLSNAIFTQMHIHREYGGVVLPQREASLRIALGQQAFVFRRKHPFENFSPDGIGKKRVVDAAIGEIVSISMPKPPP